MILRESKRDENKTIIIIMFQICHQNESLSYPLLNLTPPTSYRATLGLSSGEVVFREGGKNTGMSGWVDGDCKKLSLTDSLIS